MKLDNFPDRGLIFTCAQDSLCEEAEDLVRRAKSVSGKVSGNIGSQTCFCPIRIRQPPGRKGGEESAPPRVMESFNCESRVPTRSSHACMTDAVLTL